MIKVQTPVEGFTGTVAGVTFSNGAGETDDSAALAYFRRRGYTVEESPFPDGDPSDAWKVPALQAWAKAHDVDLAGATKKDDILAAIAAASKPADAGNPPA